MDRVLTKIGSTKGNLFLLFVIMISLTLLWQKNSTAHTCDSTGILNSDDAVELKVGDTIQYVAGGSESATSTVTNSDANVVHIAPAGPNTTDQEYTITALQEGTSIIEIKWKASDPNCTGDCMGICNFTVNVVSPSTPSINFGMIFQLLNQAREKEDEAKDKSIPIAQRIKSMAEAQIDIQRIKRMLTDNIEAICQMDIGDQVLMLGGTISLFKKRDKELTSFGPLRAMSWTGVAGLSNNTNPTPEGTIVTRGILRMLTQVEQIDLDIIRLLKYTEELEEMQNDLKSLHQVNERIRLLHRVTSLQKIEIRINLRDIAEE